VLFDLDPGVHALPFADYLALDAWGSGSLKAMRRGPPARVVWERDRESFDTDATVLGSAVHCALLTPELFAAGYEVKPEGLSFASREGKAWRDDPARAGRTLLSHGAGETVKAILEALQCKREVKAALDKSTSRETSLVWDCSVTGERCKARPDWTQGHFIYDLKVSRHASGEWLARRAFDEGWMHQLAHYRTGAIELGLDIKGGRLVVVEPTPPHFVFTLQVKTDALDLLEIENIETVKKLRDCRVSGVWPGPPEWTKIEPPASANMDEFNDVLLSESDEAAELDEEFA
jgi:hypothetical protein